MKFYNWVIKYRLYIGVAFLILAIVANIFSGFWPAFLPYLIGVVLIAGHFFFGPMRLIQEYMESGDMDGAEKILAGIKFPNLLYKPIRSVFFTLKGNIAMMKQDFDSAEKHLKKSSELGAPMPEAEGANKLQLGMLCIQRGDMKQGESYIRQAIRAGLPDSENNAAAYLQLCSIMMNKREFRAAKDYFRKAKSFKATTPQIVDQIKQIEKYITRMPG